MSGGLTDGFWRGRPVALTGATGFLGLHVVRLLRQLGARIRAVVRPTSKTESLQRLQVECITASLLSPEQLRRALTGQDMVLHLAGAVHLRAEWQEVWQTNVEGTCSVLEAGRCAGVRRMVHVSSIVTVGATREPRLLDESAAWNLGHLRVPYVLSKHRAEMLAWHAAARGQDVVIVNPGCVIGPQDYSRSEFGVLCRRFWCGRIPLVFHGGSNFVDVRDVAAGILLAAERGRSGRRYILGGVNRTWLDFFRDLARLSPRPLPRCYAPRSLASLLAFLEPYCYRHTDKRPYISPAQAELLSWFFFMSSRRASEELGYSPRSWTQTLQDTYQFWMQSQAA